MEQNIIPLNCPFTGKIIFDSEGYHEPFPETLLYYFLEEDIFLFDPLKITREICNTIEEVRLSFPSRKEGKKFSNNLLTKFTWLHNISNLIPFKLIAAHPLVKTVVDQNDYKNPSASYYYPFCFALPTNKNKIINDLETLQEFLSNLNPK